MHIDTQTVLFAMTGFVGAIVWLVRLEGRINLTASQFSEIIRRLERIENQDDHRPR